MYCNSYIPLSIAGLIYAFINGKSLGLADVILLFYCEPSTTIYLVNNGTPTKHFELLDSFVERQGLLSWVFLSLHATKVLPCPPHEIVAEVVGAESPCCTKRRAVETENRLPGGRGSHCC